MISQHIFESSEKKIKKICGPSQNVSNDLAQYDDKQALKKRDSIYLNDFFRKETNTSYYETIY